MDIIKDPSNSVLRKMAIPIGLGMFTTILFQVVDTYFVGTLGPRPLTALGFASTVYFLLIGLIVGLSMAASIILGKALGEGKSNDVKRIATLSLLISAIITTFISVIGYISIDSMFSSFGADTATLLDIRAYMVPMYFGMPILAFGVVASAILRTSGMASIPEIIFGLGGIINLVLDYAFIFGKLGLPALGIQGVAIGTVISWCFIFCCMVIALLKQGYLTSHIGDWQENAPIIKAIFKFGFPSIVAQLIPPFTIMFVTYLLGRQSAEAVAGFGVASRIETLLLIGIMGVCTALTPFIAQNMGAKLINRIDEAIVFGGKAATYLGTFLVGGFLFIIKPVAALFSNDIQIIDTTVDYFYLMAVSYVFFGLYQITTSIFNGLQLPLKALKLMLVKTFILTIPFTLIGSNWGIQGIIIGLSIANILGGIYARIEMRNELKRVQSSLVKRNPMRDMINDFKLILTR